MLRKANQRKNDHLSNVAPYTADAFNFRLVKPAFTNSNENPEVEQATCNGFMGSTFTDSLFRWLNRPFFINQSYHTVLLPGLSTNIIRAMPQLCCPLTKVTDVTVQHLLPLKPIFLTVKISFSSKTEVVICLFDF